ncbi:hypothetical protein LAUMK191_02822 [Mycobacterium attenuatum]|uniref:Uncharacterized protein n=1 Tax=Mycobacterium attenuatum TaxID=2341086 RepID=A0A498Q1N3_9MYCO|nr:hypothetical protein LAUMK136_02851 [Mycobacterium attenuatum]VBA53524.1 hypothetical protein LAUMK191_02822 [Mycobacterium attenuatum]VBA58325.1 hypothetical protein LAUMK41_02898 [Mycobacterium attenuatum]
MVPGGGVAGVVAGAGAAAVVDGGAAAVVVAGAGAGSGSAWEVAGSAMVSALALLTVATASVAHSPLRRLVLEST